MKSDALNFFAASSLLGIAFSFGLGSTHISTLACVASAVLYVLLCANAQPRLLEALRHFNALGITWLLLIVLNIAIMSWQNALAEYPVKGLRIAVQQLCVTGIFVDFAVRFRDRGVVFVVGALATAFCVVAAANLAADRSGFSLREIEGIQEGFGTNYDFIQSRWISPLTNQWHLSGMLRWAAPVILFLLLPWAVKRSSSQTAYGTLALACGLYSLVLLQYRSSVFPLIAVALCTMLKIQAFRLTALWVSFVYFITAPFLWSSDAFIDFVTDATPSFLLLAAGNQDATGVFALSGRSEIYKHAVSCLADFPLIIGMGQRFYDGSLIVGILPSMEERFGAFSTLPFHQGFLDILAIYGILPGLVVAAMLGKSVLTITECSRNARKTSPQFNADCRAATLSLIAAFVSLSQDSFLKDDNAFFFILLGSFLPVFERATSKKAQS